MTRARLIPAAGPIALLVLGLLASAQLWVGPGMLNTRAGGDSPFLLQRTFELAQGLRAGLFPVRWMPDAAFGLGYPFFNFYASLPYYGAAGLTLVGFDLLTAIRLIQTIGMMLAGLALWRLARLWLAPPAAFAAATVYMLAPFHLVNLYVRGDSLSEFWAFVWYPLALSGLLRLGRSTDSASRVPAWLELTLSLAALALTHNVSTLLFAPLVGIIAVIQIVARARANLRQAASHAGWLALSGVASLALSATFWLPALAESALVQLGDQTTGYFSYLNHFRGLDLVQASLAFDYALNAERTPFVMGLAQALLVLAGLAGLFVNRVQRDGRWLSAGGLIAATWLITPLSEPVWRAIPMLQLAQFPWRVLSVQAMFGALCAGALLQPRGNPAAGSVMRWLAAVGGASVLAVLMLANVPNARLEVQASDVTPGTLKLYEWLTGNIGTTIRAEYLPASAVPRPATGPDLLALSGALTRDGDVAQRLVHSAAGEEWLVLISGASAEVVLPITYWPGWTARLGTGAPLPLHPAAGTGWLAFELPRGEHRVSLALTGTPLERAATTVSILAVMALLVPAQLSLGWSRLARPVLVALLTMAALAGAGMLAAARAPAAEQPALLSMDFATRPFPHRAPLTFRALDGATFRLLQASTQPAIVGAGEPFSLTLRWFDDRQPDHVEIQLESPVVALAAPASARIFRYESVGWPVVAGANLLRAPAGALYGPLLMRITATQGGAPAVLLSPDGEQNNDIRLLGPTVATVRRVELPPVLAEFGPIRMHGLDWFQQDTQRACIRPAWSTSAQIGDALQVSLRLRGVDGRLIASADGQPLAGLAPTWSWSAGILIRDSYCDVPVVSPLAPGEAYTLEVIWYRFADGQVWGSRTFRGTREAVVEAMHAPR